MIDAGAIGAFQQLVWEQGRLLYRDLPWRYCDDAYAVLVSEVMLQQTQVVRVLDYWPRWLDRFPSLDALAAASTSDVLDAWQGLGYNRRALALKKTADICASQYAGCLPQDEESLLSLPGIGPATCAGVRAFAHNVPGVYLETNVRSVFIHEFFPDDEQVSDKDIIPLVAMSCSEQDPRGWYYALLDYGAYLKKTQPNPSRRSKSHSRQSKFEGSHRQKRAEMLRLVLAEGTLDAPSLLEHMRRWEIQEGREPLQASEYHDIAAELVKEGFFNFDGGHYSCQG